MSRAQAHLLQIARHLRVTPLWALMRPVYRSVLVQKIVGRSLEKRVGFTAIVGENPLRARHRGPAPVADHAALRAAYQASALSQEPDTFVLYRIIGNDLIPRHRKGQSRENVQFILEHEEDLQDCEKRWILNRIVDPDEERAIVSLLEKHGHEYLRIAYHDEEYQRRRWDLDALPAPGYTLSGQYEELPEDFRARLYKRIYRHKNNYIVNNNGARNATLADGRERAKWVLPWDGNCFLTPLAWSAIRTAVTARPWYPYVVVPMARTRDHATLLEPGYAPVPRDEPQIAFRRDATETFNEEYYYGRRPKVELLWRLGVPGPWDEWAAEPWDLPVPEYAAEAGSWQRAGWVARLPSGSPHLDLGAGSETRRLTVRAEAVTSFLVGRDAILLRLRLAGADALLHPHPVDVSKRERARRRLPWTLERHRNATGAPARFDSFRARKRARRVLGDGELPFLLDLYDQEDARERAQAVLRWTEEDAGVRAIRRTTSRHATGAVLLGAVAAARAGAYATLSRTLLHSIDHASCVFGRLSGDDSPLLTDDRHRALWMALERLCDSCGQSLWQLSERPANLDPPFQKAGPTRA